MRFCVYLNLWANNVVVVCLLRDGVMMLHRKRFTEICRLIWYEDDDNIILLSQRLLDTLCEQNFSLLLLNKLSVERIFLKSQIYAILLNRRVVFVMIALYFNLKQMLKISNHPAGKFHENLVFKYLRFSVLAQSNLQFDLLWTTF